MARPPATARDRFTATDGSTAGGSLAWPQLGGPTPDVLKVTSKATNGHVQGIYFETAGTLVCKLFGDAAMVTMAVPQFGFFPIVPSAIDPTTTALPFVIFYGPLGPGGR